VGTLTDTVTIDGATLTCAVDAEDLDPDKDGLQVRLPGETVDLAFTYTCDGVEQGDYVGKNTATIDWTGARYPSPNTSDKATADVEVTPDGAPTNEDITLTDLLDGEEVDLPQSELNWHDVAALTDDTQTIHY